MWQGWYDCHMSAFKSVVLDLFDAVKSVRGEADVTMREISLVIERDSGAACSILMGIAVDYDIAVPVNTVENLRAHCVESTYLIDDFQEFDNHQKQMSAA